MTGFSSLLPLLKIMPPFLNSEMRLCLKEHPSLNISKLSAGLPWRNFWQGNWEDTIGWSGQEVDAD